MAPSAAAPTLQTLLPAPAEAESPSRPHASSHPTPYISRPPSPTRSATLQSTPVKQIKSPDARACSQSCSTHPSPTIYTCHQAMSLPHLTNTDVVPDEPLTPE